MAELLRLAARKRTSDFTIVATAEPASKFFTRVPNASYYLTFENSATPGQWIKMARFGSIRRNIRKRCANKVGKAL